MLRGILAHPTPDPREDAASLRRRQSQPHCKSGRIEQGRLLSEVFLSCSRKSNVKNKYAGLDYPGDVMTRAETPETRVTMEDCRHLVPEHLMPLSSRRPLRRNRRLVFLGSQQPVHLFHFPASCSLRSNTTMVWEHCKTE
ncbi:hypothetical protein P7K49_025196 [Saguinus oedipus]|uniref:Uncharacterized protein n=1 Tax=Saguinus oedipus TaxID=9490 RepID=A0ABQ9UGE7_SAGOE|nr:hypothetical protein P7K49_025196 [Saguinus oedipus]